MALEPRENQFKWFVKLVETQGLEAANKYTEILRQVQLSMEPTHIAKPTLSLSNAHQAPSMPNLGQNVDMAFDSLLSGPAPILSDLLAGAKDSNASIDANAFPMLPTNTSISNRNGHRSMLNAADMINAHNSELSIANQQQLVPPPTSHAQATSELWSGVGAGALIRATADAEKFPSDIEKFQQTQSNVQQTQSNVQQHQHQQQQQQQQSIPLYRRQAGLGATTSKLNSRMFDSSSAAAAANRQLLSAATSDQIENNIFENIFNHNGGLSMGNATGHGDQHHNNQYGNAIGLSGYQNMVSMNNMSQLHAGQDHLAQHSSTTTYASVLSHGGTNQQQQHQQNTSIGNKQMQLHQHNNEEKDPFAAIRELGQRGNGLYNYFQ